MFTRYRFTAIYVAALLVASVVIRPDSWWRMFLVLMLLAGVFMIFMLVQAARFNAKRTAQMEAVGRRKRRSSDPVIEYMYRRFVLGMVLTVTFMMFRVDTLWDQSSTVAAVPILAGAMGLMLAAANRIYAYEACLLEHPEKWLPTDTRPPT